MRSKRLDRLAQRPINRETFINPWPEVGLIAIDSPLDPSPSLEIEDGVVVELEKDLDAPLTAAFVREAAEVYQERGILRNS